MRTLCLSLALAVVALAPAQSVKVPKELRANYKAIETAWRKGDVEAFTAFMDPNFEYHSADGKTESLSQFKSEVAGMLKGSTKQTIVVKYTSFTGGSDMAEVGFD